MWLFSLLSMYAEATGILGLGIALLILTLADYLRRTGHTLAAFLCFAVALFFVSAGLTLVIGGLP